MDSQLPTFLEPMDAQQMNRFVREVGDMFRYALTNNRVIQQHPLDPSDGSHDDGPLTETYGGTNQTTFTAGDILYSDASDSLDKLPIGASLSFLKVNSSGTAPEWATASASCKNSIEVDAGAYQFVNDAASPGNNKVYGTSGAGVRGYKDQTAAATTVSASGFSGNLGVTDTDVQTALGTIDAMSVGGGSGICVTKIANYTVQTADEGKLILVNTVFGNRIINLQASTAYSNGFTIGIKKVDVGANTVSVTPNGADTVEGSAPLVLAAQYDFVVLKNEGSGIWWIIAQ